MPENTETVDENGASPAEDVAAPHTPDYNTDADADRYPAAIPSPIPAHTVFKGNPQIDGPYLDDVHEAQADARRQADNAVADIQRRKAEEGQQLLETLREANAKVIDITTGGEVTDNGLSPNDETVVGEPGGPTGDNDGSTVPEENTPESEEENNVPPAVTPLNPDNNHNDSANDPNEPWNN